MPSYESSFPTLGFSTLRDFYSELLDVLFDRCFPKETFKELFIDNSSGVYFLVDRDGCDLNLFEATLSNRLWSLGIELFPVNFARFAGTRRAFVQTLTTLVFLSSNFGARLVENAKDKKDGLIRILDLSLQNNQAAIRFLQCKSLDPHEMSEVRISKDLSRTDDALRFLEFSVRRFNELSSRVPLFYFKSIPWTADYIALDTSVFRLFELIAVWKTRGFIVLTGTMPDTEIFNEARRSVKPDIRRLLKAVCLRTLTSQEAYETIYHSLWNLSKKQRESSVRAHPFTPEVIRLMIRKLFKEPTSINRLSKTLMDVWGKVVAEHRASACYDDVIDILSEAPLRRIEESLPTRLELVQEYYSRGQIAYDRSKDVFKPLGYLWNFWEIDGKLRSLGYRYDRSIRGWTRFS